MALIELTDVTYRYPTGTQPALQGINFQVAAGEFVAVIGANGAGKTTLCYTLAGFVPHFYPGELSGGIYIAGKETRQQALADLVLTVGLVFQNPYNQISGAKFTVYEEIAFGLENLGIAPAEMHPRIEQAMQLTGISELAQRSPFALSGGQQQRLALASMLVMQPKVLVLDEPTSQLDPVGSREVFSVIRTLSQQGITVIMTEHKLEWVAAFAQRVLVLDAGRIVLDGPPATVLTSPLLESLAIGQTRYTAVASRAQHATLWPSDRPLPVTLDAAAAGFRQVRP
jgi:energy-coupling factor transporter ATP-binding protein EcfA2